MLTFLLPILFYHGLVQGMTTFHNFTFFHFTSKIYLFVFSRGFLRKKFSCSGVGGASVVTPSADVVTLSADVGGASVVTPSADVGGASVVTPSADVGGASSVVTPSADVRGASVVNQNVSYLSRCKHVFCLGLDPDLVKIENSLTPSAAPICN